MKRLIALASLLLISFAVTVGCGDKATTKSTTTTTGPGGTTEVEHKDTVKQTGDNPPKP